MKTQASQMSGDESFEKIGEGMYRCKGCGAEVPSGIFNISGHWAVCTGKQFTENLMQQMEARKLTTLPPVVKFPSQDEKQIL